MANQHFTDFAPAGGVTVKEFLAEKEADAPWGRTPGAEAHPAAAAARVRRTRVDRMEGTLLEGVRDVGLDAVVEARVLALELRVPVHEVDAELDGVVVEVDRNVGDGVEILAAGD